MSRDDDRRHAQRMADLQRDRMSQQIRTDALAHQRHLDAVYRQQLDDRRYVDGLRDEERRREARREDQRSLERQLSAGLWGADAGALHPPSTAAPAAGSVPEPGPGRLARGVLKTVGLALLGLAVAAVAEAVQQKAAEPGSPPAEGEGEG